MKRILESKFYNPGTRTALPKEEYIDNISFNIHKFNNRPKPKNSKRIVVFSMFSEFGCETLALLYCIPKLLKQFQGCYTIAVGWYGRQYLYQHLVDEYWEIKEEFQWMREYARAFHNESKNLKRLEKNLKNKYGYLVGAQTFGQISVGNTCLRCKHVWADNPKSQNKICPNCACSDNLDLSLIGNVNYWKDKITPVSKPSDKKIVQAWQYLQPNSVGIFARNRKCYGRNLQPEFYIKLINLLKELKYNPVWLGEKASTMSCPVSDILDFSRCEESRDLELTLAIISELKFTVQFWTASTRLAGMMGVPYLLFESPDQIWGNGQEGARRNLCDLGPSKLAVCHYLSVYNDNDAGIEVVRRCISEMEQQNYEDVVGVVESPEVVAAMRNGNNMRIGGP